MPEKNTKEQCLARARALVDHLEADNEEEVARLLGELTTLRERESNLFLELGKLTRQLHEALNNFRLDSRITRLAQDDIPDARDRLNYVITMTEQAAHRTLNAVEETLPVSEQIEQRAHALKQDWERFRSRAMTVEEFRQLSREIEDFLGWAAQSGAQIHGNLSEVLMAQDYQDLTGQIIRRVINLVHELEENLIDLVKISGGKRLNEDGEDKEAPDPRARLEGPQLPGQQNEDVMGGQDDVDALLSSLGF